MHNLWFTLSDNFNVHLLCGTGLVYGGEAPVRPCIRGDDISHCKGRGLRMLVPNGQIARNRGGAHFVSVSG